MGASQRGKGGGDSRRQKKSPVRQNVTQMPKFAGTQLSKEVKYQMSKPQGGMPDPITGYQPDWIKNIPRFHVGPGQPTGSLAKRPDTTDQQWRQSFGLPQGVTFNTGQQVNMEPGFGGINRFLRVIPTYQGEQRPELASSMDTSARDRRKPAYMEQLQDQQADYDQRFPFGNLYYNTVRDLLSTGANPIGLSATGIIGPDTLKLGMPPYVGQIYGPPAPTPPIANRSYDTIEDIRLNRGAPDENEVELPPDMPAFTGGPVDEPWPYEYRRGGGGGGGGGYTPVPKGWFQDLYKWRV